MFLAAEPIVKTKNDKKQSGVEVLLSVSIRIIDTDFEETADCWSVFEAIVDVYGRRNLNVPANLAVYIQNNPNVVETYEYYKTKPEFAKYSDEVDKYLMLV